VGKEKRGEDAERHNSNCFIVAYVFTSIKPFLFVHYFILKTVTQSYFTSTLLEF